MTPGTGPGRGTPWWRWLGRTWTLSVAPGLYGREPVRLIPSDRREGRTVAVIGR